MPGSGEQKTAAREVGGGQAKNVQVSDVQGVNVSLTPMRKDNQLKELWYPASLLRVDKLALEGRVPTGLGSGSQGDHTIADAFIKWYQQNTIEGELLPDVFLTYRHWAKDFADGEGVCQETTRARKSEEYARRASKQAETGLQKANTEQPVHYWRILTKEMIANFNGAYAHSYWSTWAPSETETARSACGKGEGEGMEAVRAWEQSTADESLFAHMDKISRLLDIESMKQLDPGYGMELYIEAGDLEEAIDSIDNYLHPRQDQHVQQIPHLQQTRQFQQAPKPQQAQQLQHALRLQKSRQIRQIQQNQRDRKLRQFRMAIRSSSERKPVQYDMYVSIEGTASEAILKNMMNLKSTLCSWRKKSSEGLPKKVNVIMFRFLNMLQSTRKNAWNAQKRQTREEIRQDSASSSSGSGASSSASAGSDFSFNPSFYTRFGADSGPGFYPASYFSFSSRSVPAPDTETIPDPSTESTGSGLDAADTDSIFGDVTEDSGPGGRRVLPSHQ